MKHLAILGVLLTLQHNVFADPARAASSPLQLGPQVLGDRWEHALHGARAGDASALVGA